MAVAASVLVIEGTVPMVITRVLGELVPVPFVAVSETEYEPSVVGVPVMTPLEEADNPGGSVPVTAYDVGEDEAEIE